ncbi:DUF4405 domain-containing protein [Anaerosporobacter sp.]|uniref:DUF4405 domain-containing protein n=1 Tax=Anaerosporobacter sp. TaxID=1872529 RepID=UPI00286EF230|nr:DUF4405 domain-containing protein [Anaerosporobacter sp.]
MKVKNKKSLNKRAIVSVSLLFMFILLPISGQMIGIVKDNPEAHYFWGGTHCLLGLLFSVFGIFHIVYNWKSLKYYLKKK